MPKEFKIKMQIVTFNIKLGVDSHLAQIAKDILLMNPDICVLQEIGDGWQMGVPLNQTAYLASALNLPYFQFIPALEDSKGGHFGIGILSKYQISESQIDLLPSLKDEQRVLFSAKIQVDQNCFHLHTTHLSIFEEERNLQFDWICQKIKQQMKDDLPIVVVGDLNDLENSQGIENLKDLGLIDTWRFLHPNTQGQDSYTFSVKKPNRRIDYLFSRGFEIKSAEILRCYCSSDHFPLKVRLNFNDSLNKK